VLGSGLATDGFGGYVCGVLTGFIATAAANVHGNLLRLTNHGIWARYYWTGGYHTPGGYW
jgi:hypothetical protein